MYARAMVAIATGWLKYRNRNRFTFRVADFKKKYYLVEHHIKRAGKNTELSEDSHESESIKLFSGYVFFYLSSIQT